MALLVHSIDKQIKRKDLSAVGVTRNLQIYPQGVGGREVIWLMVKQNCGLRVIYRCYQLRTRVSVSVTPVVATDESYMVGRGDYAVAQ